MDAVEFFPTEIDSVIAALTYREREEVSADTAAEFMPAIAAEPSQQAIDSAARVSVSRKCPATRDRYREMRTIKGDMPAKDFADIPRQLTSMVRIWEGTAVETGLRRRRLDEAKLFTAGLAAATPASV